jgi:hypothetical protein
VHPVSSRGKGREARRGRFPITNREIEDCLLSDRIRAERRVGDIRPLLLLAAAGIVRNADPYDGLPSEQETLPS